MLPVGTQVLQPLKGSPHLSTSGGAAAPAERAGAKQALSSGREGAGQPRRWARAHRGDSKPRHLAPRAPREDPVFLHVVIVPQSSPRRRGAVPWEHPGFHALG